MKTRTIFRAFLTARNALEDRYILHGFARASMEIKVSKFYNELLRRMDERDALVASRNMNKTRTFTDEGGRFMTITGKWGI